MNCPHHKPHPFAPCRLMLYGGKPTPENCSKCIAAGENNPEFAAALFARADITHPPDKPQQCGCCDSAAPGKPLVD